MTKQTQQRCLTMFLEAIGSPITKKGYLYQLDRFLKWNKINAGNYDALLKADDKSIQRNLEDYLIYLKNQGKSPNYIPIMIAPVELFYTMNEVNLNSKRLHKIFPTRIKKGGYGSYTREDIQTMLLATKKKRTRSLILFLSSTGCRVGAIPELKLKHITNIENCKQVIVYAESKDEYVTFMTPEASKSFDNYLEERQQDNERLGPDSPAFRKDYQLGSSHAESMQTGTIRNALNVTIGDVSKTKTGSRFNIPMVHGLRKYFNVTLKSRSGANLSLCEKMMGHSVTIQLDNHYAPFSNNSLFEEYKKAISELTISDEERQRVELENKDRKIKELDDPNLKNQSAQLKQLQNDFMRMKFDLAELLRQEGKKSKLNSSLKKYPDLKKHIKFGDNEDDVYIKDIDDGEIVY